MGPARSYHCLGRDFQAPLIRPRSRSSRAACRSPCHMEVHGWDRCRYLKRRCMLFNRKDCKKSEHSPHAFSSEPSVQSFFPSQKRSLLIQMESPHASLLFSQRGSSVLSRGFTFFSLVSLSQFFTAHFQSHVCFSRSKARPGGHRMACRP